LLSPLALLSAAERSIDSCFQDGYSDALKMAAIQGVAFFRLGHRSRVAC